MILVAAAGCSSLTKKGGLVNVTPALLASQEDVNLLKNQVSGKMGVIEGEVVGVKSEVLGLKGDMSLIKGNLENLSAQLSAQGQAVAGFNNRLEATTAGRDITTSTTNDTELMRYIVGVLAGLCSTLIGLLGWCLKTLLRRDKEKDFYKKMVFTKVAHDEDDVFKIKQAHDQFVKGKKEAV